MFDAVGDLKDRLESRAIEFYEKWDLEDTCGWLIPAETDVDEFMARQTATAENEERIVGILEKLRSTVDAIPLLLLQELDKLHRAIDAEAYGKLFNECVQGVGLDILPTDATEFVKMLTSRLQGRANGSLQILPA